MTTEYSYFHKISVFLEMIKFSHTIFALPFALTGAILAANGIPQISILFWIILSMTGARTAAMGLNRLIDADIDANNPRTAGRAIPAGQLSKSFTFITILLSFSLLLISAAQLNPLCLKLSPLAVFFLVLYSYCKRFTSLAHIVLGICLAAAPIGAWVAIRGTIELPAIVLGGLVLFWVSGFDILYALQDLEFDRTAGLHSIPVLLGVNRSLWTARIFHLVMVILLLFLWNNLQLHIFFALGIAITTAMLLYEHWLLKDGDLTKLNAAFFTMNGYISIAILLFTTLDLLLR